jgi:hypothetical protein
MITKTVFQTSNDIIPEYVSNLIKERCPGWEYNQYNSEQIETFFKENVCEEFPNIFDKYSKVTSEQHKMEIFRYYYLYLNGGLYIHHAAMIEVNVNKVIKDYDFVSVLSLNTSSIFHGIMATIPKNNIIKKALQYMYYGTNTNLTSIGEYLYNIIHDEKKMVDCQKIHLYQEVMSESKYFIGAYDVEQNEKLFTHYFHEKIIPKPYVKPTSIQNTKIGITFMLTSSAMDIFTNGIKQNGVFFYDLLYNIGYDVYMIVPDDSFEDSKIKSFWNKDYIKYIKLSNMLKSDLHLIFQFCFQIEENVLDFLSVCGIKTVFYNCGNKYIVDSESCIYDTKGSTGFQFNNFTHYKFTQVWLIPQHVKTFHYMKTFYRCEVKNVPFIWGPTIIEGYESELGKSIKYTNRGESKQIAIFEPNLSIIKWCIPSILVCENAYRTITNKDKIKHLYVTNIQTTTKKMFNVELFNTMVKSLDLFKTKKMSVEARYNSVYFMHAHADIAVSHQMENPLNYLYLDLAWMGWPIVHNAHMCNDVGYYYEEFDYDQGAEVLKNVIMTHDDTVEEYTKRNRVAIHKYLPTNKYLQDKYIQLINDVL